MSSSFSPIAIVGQGVVLPGATTVAQFNDDVHNGRSQVRDVPAGRWGIDAHLIRSTKDRPLDGTVSLAGSYVDDDAPLALDDLAMSPTEIHSFDPLFAWVVHAARTALDAAGFPASARDRKERVGLVMGNLSFPTEGMARFGAHARLSALRPPFFESDVATTFGMPRPNPLDRFMSGLPMHLVARALGIRHGAFALDAACASSLYAIALAAKRLERGEIDVALAGAVNRADNLFLHVGFSALSALSATGQSRPFHRDADGLVPGEGCGVVALMRLDDAQRANKEIFGVIRGVGLSNDGRARNLLAPAVDGQVRAMNEAWRLAELSPLTAGYVECHATGTPIGDATEIESMTAVFRERAQKSLPIGSLKSNLGHLITAAGVAGLVKVLGAFRRGSIPPSLHADTLTNALVDDTTPFEVAKESREFPPSDDGVRRAGVSAFGFGGNNAHLIVDDQPSERSTVSVTVPAPPRIAIVGLRLRIGDHDAASVKRAVDDDAPIHDTTASSVGFSPRGVRFPPQDLKDALPQQIAMLEMARALADTVPTALRSPVTSGTLVGMQCDVDVTSPGLRWRLPALAGNAIDSTMTESWKDAFCPPVSAQRVLGQMPNIPANRLNVQLDLKGPGFTISAEENSGVIALDVAKTMLEDGRLDTCLVGAVDFATDTRDRRALRSIGVTKPADAAVMLLLVREADAKVHGLPIIAFVDDVAQRSGGRDIAVDAAPPLGHAHAAQGLVDVAAAILRTGEVDARVTVDVHALGGAETTVVLTRGAASALASSLEGAPASDPHFVSLPARRPLPVLAAPKNTMPHMPLAPELTTTATIVADATLSSSSVCRNATMSPAPTLAPVLGNRATPAHIERAAPPPSASTWNVPTTTAAIRPADENNRVPFILPSNAPATVVTVPSMSDAQAKSSTSDEENDAVIADAFSNVRNAIAAAHQGFLDEASRAHQAFLKSRADTLQSVLSVADLHDTNNVDNASGVHASAPSTTTNAAFNDDRRMAPARVNPALHQSDATAVAPMPTVSATVDEHSIAEHTVEKPAEPPIDLDPKNLDFTSPEGKKRLAARRETPWIDRRALEQLASHPISQVMGPVFKGQDNYARVVRMPEAPLLLCDRVLGCDVTLGTLEPDRTIVTESDVTLDKWYLHNGHIPAGILIESGQADLLAVSFMGVDADNKGERVYRLLGCDLTYRKRLPPVGTTLHYDIHIDGFANHGDTRIFFFHSDCREGGPEGDIVLSVRGGQAGFFSDEELRHSGGILWSPTTANAPSSVVNDAFVTTLPSPLEKRTLTRDELVAVSEGHVGSVFGASHRRALSHVRTPTIQSGDMLLIDRVTTIEPNGGPWGRGYLRAELDLTGENWFFDGHFKNDPCMPGTIMFEGCLQCLDVFAIAQGLTLERDGWRFEPTKDEAFKLRCRGQATRSSRHMVYEVFVRDVVDGPRPRVVADILVTVDGLKGLHCENTGVELVVDWPLSSHPELTGGSEKRDGKDAVRPRAFNADASSPVVFDQQSLLATAWGRPSDAFAIYAPFDDGTRVPRLPGPPYHFMSRVSSLTGPAMGAFESGNVVVVDYDVPQDAWYFDSTPDDVMPYSVLLEVALQPCGWLSSFTGSVLTTDEPLYYRNLDGKCVVTRPIRRDVGTLSTRATMTSISASAGMIIQSFKIEVTDDDGPVFEGTTVFGFFPEGALARQVGIGFTDDEKAVLSATSAPVNGTAFPLSIAAFRDANANIVPDDMLTMIDRVTGYWPTGGKHDAGRLVAEKDVDASEWFFKAHFFQDPVQPGSLGIQAMLDTLAVGARISGHLDDDKTVAAIAHHAPITWKYRGQVTPKNQRVTIVADIVEVSSSRIVAECWLWVDGLRIYHAERIGLDIVSRG